MFSHIMIGTNDIARAKGFYDAVLGSLGVEEGQLGERKGIQRVFYRHDGDVFAITEPVDGQPATVGNGSTFAFHCTSSEQAQRFHDIAVANGGTSVEDAPGIRHASMGEMFLAYVRDPDGNKLCAIHRIEAAE